MLKPEEEIAEPGWEASAEGGDRDGGVICLTVCSRAVCEFVRAVTNPRRANLKARERRHAEFVQRDEARRAPRPRRRVEEEEEAAEPLPLDKLAPEVLNIIAEALAADEDDPPAEAISISLARSCKVIKEAVKDAKDKLKVEYTAARALVVKFGGYSVERLVVVRPTTLNWTRKGLTAADAPALTNVLKSKAMARVEELYLYSNNLGEEAALPLQLRRRPAACRSSRF